jgi:FeS assembly SUF system regulator
MRINKLTDYSIVIMTNMVIKDEKAMYTAKELSEVTNVPLPTVTRILKMLSNGELLNSQRGPQGGYSLTRNAKDISVAEVIEAMEGPISLTECASDDCGCSYEANCAVGKPWQKINKAIREVLQSISLAEMGIRDESQQLLKLTNLTEMSF